MGTAYLLDTNIVIYYLGALMPIKALDFVEGQLYKTGSFISVISKIELLGWHAPTTEAMNQVEGFVADSQVLLLSEAIIDKTIEIRRTNKVRLPDAIIAATAIVNDLTLMSRNDGDFHGVLGLKYYNPFLHP